MNNIEIFPLNLLKMGKYEINHISLFIDIKSLYKSKIRNLLRFTDKMNLKKIQ